MLVPSETFSLNRMADAFRSPDPYSGGGTAPRQAVALSRLQALVAQMAGGRQEALASLYDETSPLLNGLLRRMLEKAEDAEEVLLDVYLKAWKNASTYSEERGSVQSWLV